ncbi:MAG: ABC-three component system protein [Pseudomonadota bacterium]
MEKSNPGVKLKPWGFEELREIFRRLEKQDLESWFGYAPNGGVKAKMGFEEIRVVLETIGSKKPDTGAPAKEVPPGKIEANQLSDNIATLIKEGMGRASLVDAFFKKWHDPTFGERIAASFREQYENLRGKQTPNEIFYKFQEWVGGSKRGTAEHEMAVLTVIAYYFESCDIFEEPRGLK